MVRNMAVPDHRVMELEDEIARQSRAIEDSRIVGSARIDAVRRLRILSNALELIRPLAG
jgi:hypothetical protein